jgi:hypothetical protein
MYFCNMRKIETTGQIKNGSLKIANRQKFIDSIRSMNDCPVILTIRKKYNQRSNEQNAYYWGVIIEFWKDILLAEWGEHLNAHEVHEFLKTNFNAKDVLNEATGELLRLPKSTTKNTTTEQEEFHEVCRQKAFEMFNVMIPLPNEQLELENFNI